MVYDIIIAGAGAAGLTASMYAQRAGLNSLVIEKLFVGGQTATTFEIENYPGFLEVSGPDLMDKFHQHAKKFGSTIINAEITELILDQELKTVKTTAGDFSAKAIIIATGAKPRNLNVSGEQELAGRGVSYCATCDGAFYRKKTTAVVGGGNTAVEDAIFLSRLCEKVYLVHRRDAFRADKSLVTKLHEIKNIELVLNAVPVEIQGSEFVTALSVQNADLTNQRKLDVDGVFVAVGITPNNQLAKDILKLDEQGYIITDERLMTSIKGVFAAGDIRNTPLRQIVTAAADGAIAAYSASQYLAEL